MIEYDPFAYQLHEDPYPTYRQLRDEAPAYFSPRHGFWALSRYADVRRALKDAAAFSSVGGVVVEDIEAFALPMLVGMDEPDHMRLRDIVKRSWTKRQVMELAQPIRELTRGYVDRFAGTGEAEIMADLAGLLPMAVISELLSVPQRDRDMIRSWADLLVVREDGVKGVPEASQQGFRQIYAYFDKLSAERGSDPGDDLLGLLLTAERENVISRDELLGFCFLLIVAGNETTMKLIGNLVYYLGLHPEQKTRLLEQPALIPGAVEEGLRYDSSVQLTARTLKRDVELHGEKLREGEKVALLLASANRDERQFAEPDRFDVARDASGHLGFGIGTHFCLGATLARLETTMALAELLERIPDYEVDYSGVERVNAASVRGLNRLPIRFTTAA
jgi:cytochrome P450